MGNVGGSLLVGLLILVAVSCLISLIDGTCLHWLVVPLIIVVVINAAGAMGGGSGGR